MMSLSTLTRNARSAVDYVLYRNLETLLSVPGRKLYAATVRASNDVRRTQAELLADVLRYAGDTAYGRDHGFRSMQGYEDYCQRVPVNDYENLRSLIDRHANGETDVLFPGKPMMYNQSSGTTALPKLIPVTSYNFERTIKNRGKLWLYRLMKQFPGVYAGKDVTVVSPAVDGYTADGTPFGSVSGLVFKNIPSFLARGHSAPYAVCTIRDYETRTYVLARCALASDVSLILTVNPSTILNLVSRVDAWKEQLIRDIHDGTLSRDLTPELQRDLAPSLKADRKRAAELDRLASHNDCLRPADYWPQLRLVHTWKHGNCALVVPKLKPWFREDTPMLDFGYLASEIQATDLFDPSNDGSILQMCSAFYEFSPFENEGGPNERKLLAHELEVGRRYFLYVTTLSGLYRYDMNDVIEVVGHFGQAPVIRFLFKGKGITSLEGEKLSEEQLIEAMRRAGDELGIRYDFFVAYADAELHRYRLHVEMHDDSSPAILAKFGKALDHALMTVNIEYESKRKSARLHAPMVIDAGRNFFERYKALRLAEGAPEGQFKWMHLTASKAMSEKLALLSGLPREMAG